MYVNNNHEHQKIGESVCVRTYTCTVGRIWQDHIRWNKMHRDMCYPHVSDSKVLSMQHESHTPMSWALCRLFVK